MSRPIRAAALSALPKEESCYYLTYPGSWLLAPGSWLLAPGSWLLAPGLPLRLLPTGCEDYSDNDQPGDHEANAGTDPESVEHREQ
jgi:hypothetical protein